MDRIGKCICLFSIVIKRHSWLDNLLGKKRGLFRTQFWRFKNMPLTLHVRNMSERENLDSEMEALEFGESKFALL
jgi:hypothetical protein